MGYAALDKYTVILFGVMLIDVEFTVRLNLESVRLLTIKMRE